MARELTPETVTEVLKLAMSMDGAEGDLLSLVRGLFVSTYDGMRFSAERGALLCTTPETKEAWLMGVMQGVGSTVIALDPDMLATVRAGRARVLAAKGAPSGA